MGSKVNLSIDAGTYVIKGDYEVWWSKSPITSESADHTVLVGGTAPGNNKLALTFNVPETPYGVNYIKVHLPFRPTGSEYTKNVPYLGNAGPFTVLPDITISPTSAPPNTKVTINGTGFPADNEKIKLSFDDEDTGLEIASDELGSFSAKFTIPVTPAGNHKFKATFGTALTDYADASFTMRPSITIEPKEPEIGKDATVTGTGFAANSEISLKFDDVDITESPSTDEDGNFSCTFTVPKTSASEHIVIATDKAGHTARSDTPLESEPPPTPSTTTTTQEKTGLFGPQRVTFNWTKVSDPSGITYTLEIGDNLNFFPLQPGMRQTVLTQTSLTMELAPGTYYWRVKAIDGAGNESEWGLAPQPVKIGSSTSWYLAIGAIVFVIAFIFVVRAFLRRVREYYK